MILIQIHEAGGHIRQCSSMYNWDHFRILDVSLLGFFCFFFCGGVVFVVVGFLFVVLYFALLFVTCGYIYLFDMHT